MVAAAQATAIAASSTPNDHKTKYALAVSLVVTDLIKAYDAGDTLNFTKLKGTAAKKYKLQGIPKLADILQALPIAYRAKLLPFLQTKPVRSASGVAVVGAFNILFADVVCVQLRNLSCPQDGSFISPDTGSSQKVLHSFISSLFSLMYKHCPAHFLVLQLL